MKYLRSLEQSSVQGESAQEKSAMNDLDLIFQIHDVVQEYSNVLWEYLNNKLTFEIAQKIRDLAASVHVKIGEMLKGPVPNNVKRISGVLSEYFGQNENLEGALNDRKAYLIYTRKVSEIVQTLEESLYAHIIEHYRDVLKYTTQVYVDLKTIAGFTQAEASTTVSTTCRTPPYKRTREECTESGEECTVPASLGYNVDPPFEMGKEDLEDKLDLNLTTKDETTSTRDGNDKLKLVQEEIKNYLGKAMFLAYNDKDKETKLNAFPKKFNEVYRKIRKALGKKIFVQTERSSKGNDNYAPGAHATETKGTQSWLSLLIRSIAECVDPPYIEVERKGSRSTSSPTTTLTSSPTKTSTSSPTKTRFTSEVRIGSANESSNSLGPPLFRSTHLVLFDDFRESLKTILIDCPNDTLAFPKVVFEPQWLQFHAGGGRAMDGKQWRFPPDSCESLRP